MTRALLALALVAMTGCTFVGGVAGGTFASRQGHREENERARNGAPEGSESIMPGVLGGAAIGMLLDAVAITFLLDQARDANVTPLLTR